MNITLRDDQGALLNLTGFTAAASIRPTQQSETTYPFTPTTTPAQGLVALVLPSTISATLTPGTYVWDFQLTDASGNVRTYITGDVTVYDEVTR